MLYALLLVLSGSESRSLHWNERKERKKEAEEDDEKAIEPSLLCSVAAGEEGKERKAARN